MKENLTLRFLGVGLAMVLLPVSLFYFLPKTSAQQGDKSLKKARPEVPKMTTDSDDPSMILLNAAQINTKSEDAKALRQDVGSFEGKRMHIVKFRDAVRPEWFKMLADSGVEVIDYIPFNSYLVYGDSVSLQRIQGLSKQAASPIEWEGQYKDEYRLSPDLYVSTGDKASPRSLASMQFQVQLFKDDAVNSETLALIKSWQTTPIKGQQEIMRYVNLVVGLDEESLGKLAGRPDVISIHPYLDKQKFDERQDIIITGDLTGNVPNPQSYLTYLANKGFTQAQFDASGFAVDVTDSGIDNATPANPTQFLLRKLGDPTSTSRYIYSRLEGTANSGSTTSGCDGHGNLNSTIVAGYVPTAAPFNAFPHMDASGYHFGLGVAPFVKVGSSVIFDPSTFTNPVYANLQSRAYNDGARVSTNSWGSSLNTYTTDSQAYDSLVRDAQQAGSPFPTAGNQEMVIVFAAGNGGSGANTVGEPGTGKNVITVGASENVQAFGGADQCGTTDAEADSANDIVGFSSRGPTSDGRKKPDIVAPGTHVSGGVGQASVVSPVTGNGAQLACFDATGVCAGTGTNNFFPTGQQWYTASSGTSHSTPATAGAAALLRQHFINLGQTPPSAAMTKALLLSSARYMNGTGANDNLYSNNQGMGMVNLNGYFDIFARAKILRDQVAADKFTASGQQRIFAGTVVDNTKPFRVTLAYSDAPGSTTGNAWVNNLDLEVTVGGNTYLGNVFTGGNSTTGGTADARNNVESVFLPAGVSGPFVVKVKATNIAGNGVPNDADALDQDFALVVQNANEVPTAVIQTNSVAITAENGTPANNVPDPGETLTVNLDLQNVGTGNASNVTATLQATGGVTNPSATQNYGAMAANGAPVSKPFTFTVSPSVTCGSSITLTWQISDGTNNSTYTKTYATGTPVTSLTQNFDGVTAPALPAGWVSTASGSNTGWVTSTTSPNSAPNSAFSADPSSVGDGQLETPSMSINSASAHLKFKLNFNTEASSTPTTGYDGGVVEMKLGSGAYQDILAAGGSFVTGAYTRTISSSFSSPIAGRQAWSGTSGGWIDVDILLPASANGQTATFKWRMASDSSVSGNGIFIDDVQVVAGTSCANVSVTVKSRADYDGDGKTDVSVFRPSTGDWFINRSTAGFTVPNWGIASDVITPGDYDGDGKADVAVFRGSSSTWYILQSSNATPSITVFGAVGDVPVAGDYDGDGKTDLAVFRASTNQWIVRNSNGGSVTTTVFGATGDVPVRADYNGDGKTDIAVFRPSTNTWWIANSGGAVTATAFGATGDLPVPADYDGDNKEDIAVFRPSTGQWWTLNSTNGSVTAPVFGTTGDVPVPGDYDGDGKDDQAVYRAGTWWVNKSTGGFQTTTFGLTTDRPTPAAYIP